MRILALSDLAWNRNSVLFENIDNFTCSQILRSPDFNRVAYYYNIVNTFNPDILLLCGDITGDGSCGGGHAVSLICFLRLVEAKKIITRFIPGDHDEAYGARYLNEFQEVNKYFINSKYIKQANSKIEYINDIRIAGLTYNQTRTKTAIKQSLKALNDEMDILICHCPQTHRLHLFDFKTEFIITGHYDLKVISPNNKTLISLYNDVPSENFVVIDIAAEKKMITYYLRRAMATKWTFFNFIKTKQTFILENTNYKIFSEDIYVDCPIKYLTLTKLKTRIKSKKLFNHCPYNSFQLEGHNEVLEYVFHHCPFNSSSLKYIEFKNLSKNLIEACPFKTLHLKIPSIKNEIENSLSESRYIYNIPFQNAIEEIQKMIKKGLKLSKHDLAKMKEIKVNSIRTISHDFIKSYIETEK